MKASSTTCLLVMHLLLLSPSARVLGQWIEQPFPTDEDLWNVRFVDSTTGWVLGTQHIYRTTNAGLDWIPQDTDGPYAIWYWDALYARDLTTAFYIRYSQDSEISVIRRTTNGGADWQSVDSASFYYYDFAFLDSQIGFVVGGGTDSNDTGVIRKTTDGGATWRTTTTLSMRGQYDLEAISFADATHGWTVSYYTGLVYCTTDGGTTWAFQDTVGRNSSIPSFRPVRDVQFTTRDSGWAVGGISGFTVLSRTTNGGSTWSYTSLIASSIREIRMLNSHVGWFVGTNNWPPFIALTTNGGETWNDQSPPGSNGFESISMIDANLGWVVGSYPGRIYKTTNGGGVVVSAPASDAHIPERATLEQNYPNPFNPVTQIGYRIGETGHVSIKVFDVLGREVAILVDEIRTPGSYSTIWNADNLTSGVYLCRMQVGPSTHTRKLVLAK